MKSKATKVEHKNEKRDGIECTYGYKFFDLKLLFKAGQGHTRLQVSL